MTRTAAEKAMNRLDRYFRTILDDADYEIGTIGFRTYREAWIKTFEEAELDALDKQSKNWFIEDDDEFEKVFEELVQDYKKSLKFNKLLMVNIEKIDE